jgi:hypothetical protein
VKNYRSYVFSFMYAKAKWGEKLEQSPTNKGIKCIFANRVCLKSNLQF